MFDTRDQSWTATSVPTADPRVVICFLLQDRFYSGDPNSVAQLDDDTYYTPLALPFAGVARVATGKVLGREAALAAYYRDVVDRHARIGRDFDLYSQYFWLRLSIEWAGGAIGFPWYDSLDEMTAFVDRLAIAADGEDWFDIDQGWELLAIRRGTLFHFREGDGDGAEYLNVSLDRDTLLRSGRQACNEAVAVIAKLTAELGADVWSESTYARTISFGTASWKPGAAKR